MLEKHQNWSRIILFLIFVIPFLLIFSPFFIPILLAIFVALGLEPILYKVKLQAKNRKLFTFGLLAVSLFLIWGPLIFFSLRIVKGLKSVSLQSIQNSQFIQSLFSLFGKIQTYLSQWADMIGTEQDIIPGKDEILAKLGPFIVAKATSFLTSLPTLSLSFFVFFSFLFILTSKAKAIRAGIFRFSPLPDAEMQEILQSLQASCKLILVSTLMVGVLQALIVSIGSLIFGYHEFYLVFSATLFLSFIPVIGAAPVALALALISFLGGNSADGIGLLVVAAIAGSIDNIIKPFILSSNEKSLPPLLSLLGILGSILVFGLPGLLLGPLLLQVTVQLAPRLAEKILKTN